MLKQPAIVLGARALVPAVMLVWAASGAAHTLPISYLTLVPDENYLHLELTLNPFELAFFAELDANHNGQLEPREWEGQGERIAWRILDAVKVRVNGRLAVPDIAGLTQSYESHHITVRAHYPANARKAIVSVESQLAGITSGGHFTQVSFGHGDPIQAARLDGQSHQAQFDPIERRGAGSDATTTPARLIRSVGQHQLTVALLLMCIVSVLLMSVGSVVLLRRRFSAMRSKANISGLNTSSQFQQIP